MSLTLEENGPLITVQQQMVVKKPGSTTSLTIAHLNTSTTNTVTIPENQTSIFIDLNLDMTNEERTTLDIIAGLHYLETSTLESWGVSLVQTSNLATFPHVTADGVRLAHEGGSKSQSDNRPVPVSDIVNSITDSIDEIGSIGMSPLTWVNDSVADGISGPAGGLEYSHSQGCTGNRSTRPVLALVAWKEQRQWDMITQYICALQAKNSIFPCLT